MAAFRGVGELSGRRMRLAGGIPALLNFRVVDLVALSESLRVDCIESLPISNRAIYQRWLSERMDRIDPNRPYVRAKHIRTRSMLIALDRIGAIWHLTHSELMGDNIYDEIINSARQAAAYALRSYELTMEEIGLALNRDHSSIVYQFNRCVVKIKTVDGYAFRVSRAIAKTESLLKSYRGRSVHKPLVKGRSLEQYAKDHI